jgi:tRNA A-37 threonylcarbamoyl transferase component Bud32
VERTSAPKALGGEVLPPGAEPLQADDPAVIDGQRLTGRLASGGTSVVYLARDPGGRHVVVKTTRMRKADQTQARRWLRTEAASVRRLPAFCTPALLADGSDESPPYLIRDYVEGPSLAQFVEGLGPLEPEQLGALAVALARARGAGHGAGLIHCDLEPTNVLLASNGPRLIDFSIAQETPIAGRSAEVGTVPYNPGWVSPERLNGHPAGPASDVFGWGCLLGYAATGRSAFDGDDAGEGRWSVARPSALDALDEPIRGLVEAALAVDPADRPTTGDLVARLEGTGEREAPVPRPLPRRHDLDAVPHRTEFTVDEPTAPMPALMPALMPEHGELARALGTPPARPAPLPEAAAESLEAGQAEDLVPWQRSEPVPAPRRVEYAAEAAKAASAEPPGPLPRRVEYAAETSGSRSRAEWADEPKRHPRRLRAVAMVTAPAAMVAVLATVIAMAATDNGGPTRVRQGGAVQPGQGLVDSPQAPEDPGRHSYGPRPASASSARDHSSPPVAGQPTHGGRTNPGSPSRPGGGGHSSGHPPTYKPTPTPTHSPTPSPTPTPTGTGPADTTGGTSTSP